MKFNSKICPVEVSDFVWNLSDPETYILLLIEAAHAASPDTSTLARVYELWKPSTITHHIHIQYDHPLVPPNLTSSPWE